MNKEKLQVLYRTRRIFRYTLYFLVAISVFAVVGFFVLPPVVKSLAIEQASKALHRPVTVRAIRINPFALTLDVEGFSIKEREGEEVFAGFDGLHVNLQSASLFKRGVVVGEIRLTNPQFRIVRKADNQYNFSDLVDEFANAPKSETSSPAPAFSVNNIQLTGGRLVFDDQPMKEKHEISDVRLTLPFISNMAYAVESFIEPSFSAVVNGAPLSAKGKSKPFADSHESELAFELSNLKVAQYFDYSPVKLPIRIVSGSLDTALKVGFLQEKAKGTSLRLSGNVSLRDLDVKESSGAPVVTLKRLDVALGASDLLARDFVVDRISLDAPDVNVRLDKQGKLNLAALIPASPESAKGAAKETRAEASPPVKWKLGELVVAAGTVRLADDSRSSPFKGSIDAFDLSLKGLASQGETPSQLTSRFKINNKGGVSLDGTVSPLGGSADVNLALKSLELLPFQPYFAEKLNVAVTRGQVTADGVLKVRAASNAASGVQGQFAGQLTLGDFQAVDKLNSADFLRWKSLYFGKIDINLDPLSVSIGDIALSDFFARVIVSREGKLNLLQLVREDEAVPSAEKSAKASPPSPEVKTEAEKTGAKAPATPHKEPDKPELAVKIGKITLQGGDVFFTDNFVKPNYSAKLRKIGGRVTGLSSAPGTVADLDLRGSYDNVAPLTVKAKINPLSKKPYLDLLAEIKGVEMTSFSTYAGKYAGYGIDKGKLSLFVKYKIENDQLEAENRVFLDQLTFGDRVESPDATSLPVRLAVSLLKNRNGEIDLNLPISGSLSDPQFSVGGLVVKVIVNLIVKAVTSPFALLGSLFGGEELSMVEFAPGLSIVTPDAEKRLENLAKALIDRPALKLEITGLADPEGDQEGVKRARIDSKVKSIKREDLTKKGKESGAVETIQISAEEYPALLERAYRAEKFPKPRNMVGLVKTLPVDEMEKLMLANSKVDEEDLRELAEQRAKIIRDWLVAHEVPAERVFVLPAKVVESTAKPETEKKVSNSKAEFSLK